MQSILVKKVATQTWAEINAEKCQVRPLRSGTFGTMPPKPMELGHKSLALKELTSDRCKRPTIPFVQAQHEAVQRSLEWDWLFRLMVVEMRASGCSILSI